MINNELDDYIINKNINLLIFSISIKISNDKLYDNNGEDDIFVVFDSYRSAYFDYNVSTTDVDLLINTITTVTYSNGDKKIFNDKFTFRLLVEIGDEITMKIVSLVQGDAIRPFSKRNSLSKNLIPVIYKENYEDVADEFLHKFAPYALVNPVPIQIESLLKTLGFDVKLSRVDDDTKGYFAFRDSEVEVFNEKNRYFQEEIIPKDTVVIDYNLKEKYGIGVFNNTIIHEILHWYLHKKFVEFKLILNNGDEVYSNEEKGYLENHCNSIAPLILMPKGPSIVKYDQLLDKYLELGYAHSDAYEIAIREFAKYFNVSMASAKIRMRSLGFSENKQIINKNYLLASNGKTRFISSEDYYKILENNPQLKKFNDLEYIKYVDGYVVINQPEFITIDKNKECLTKYALANIHSCSLEFNVERINSSVAEEYSKFDTNLYSTISQGVNVTINENSLATIKRFYLNCKNEKQKRNFFIDYREYETGPFNEYLITLMERHDISTRKLEKASGVSLSVINKYRSYKEVAYSLPYILKLCGAMKAYPYETLNLIKKTGLDLESAVRSEDCTKRNIDYYYMVVYMYDAGIDEWLKYMKEHNLPTK